MKIRRKSDLCGRGKFAAEERWPSNDAMKSRDFVVHQGDDEVRLDGPRRSQGEIGPLLAPTVP
jgi:hypothetical protein